MGPKGYRDESTSTEDISIDRLEKRVRKLKKRLRKRKHVQKRHKRLRYDSSSSGSSDSSRSSASSRSSRSKSRSGSRQNDRDKSPLKDLSLEENKLEYPVKSQTGETKNNEFTLSEGLLSAVVKRLHEPKILAPPLHSEIVVRWQEVMSKGLPSEEKINLFKKYPLPENCTFSEPPKLNVERKSVIQSPNLNRDAHIILKQEKITACSAAIAKALTSLIKEGRDLEDLPTIECLSDAIKFLADMQRDESAIGRSLIMVNINTSLKESLAASSCCEFLYGNKSDEMVKSAKTIEATAKYLRAPGKNVKDKPSKNPYVPPRHRCRMAGGQKQYKTFKRASDYHHQKPQMKKDQENQNRYHKRR